MLRYRAARHRRHIRYKPYGGVRLRRSGTGVAISAATHPYEFTGYETDPTSGLQYAGARFYDPELGTFLTHDPQRQFPSPYGYGSWNPVNGVDPDGEFFFLIPVLTVVLETLSAVLSAVHALIAPLLTQLQPAVLAAAKGAATGLFKGSIEAVTTGEAKAILEGIKDGAIAGAVSGLVFDSTGLGEALDGLKGEATLSLRDFASPSDFLAKAGEAGVRGALSGVIRGSVGAFATTAVQGGDLGQRLINGSAGGAIGGAFGSLFQPAVDEISQAAVGPITGGVAQTLGLDSSTNPSGATFGSLLRGGFLRATAGGALSNAHRGVGKFLNRGLSRFGNFDPVDLAGGATQGAQSRATVLFHDQAKRFYDHHLRPIVEPPLVSR
jgi:RHS repeat-associated protein